MKSAYFAGLFDKTEEFSIRNKGIVFNGDFYSTHKRVRSQF